MNKRFKILAVDDDPVNIQVMTSALIDDYDVITAPSGHDAISQIKMHIPDLILLDVMMPDLSGFEVCSIIKSYQAYADIPVIFLTALDTTDGELRGLELGAIDYLTKPINFTLLKLRVHNHIALKERNKLVKEQRDLLESQKEELELINEQMRVTKAALRESRKQLAEIIDFLPDATLAIDREKRVIIWNRAIEEMTGIPAADMLGKGDNAYTIPFYGEARPNLMNLVFEDRDEMAARYPDVIRAGDTLILENLLTNAFRYTPSGGDVSLDVRRENNRLCLEIVDTGIGIPEKEQKLIFDAFYRSRNVLERRGLGLGLSIVSEALSQMGGTISVTSRTGEGTTMRVEIPVDEIQK